MTKPRDRVERDIFVRASLERTFAALTEPELFPTWGPERVIGKIAVGERPVFDFGFSGKVAVYIVAIEPPRYFAYRWIQGENDPAVLLGDPLARPNTLVEFHLEEHDGGTRVRVVESGIDKLPGTAPNLDAALDNMGKGWELMLGGLPRHFTFTGGDRIENELVLTAPPSRIHALLSEPSRWWFGAPALEVDVRDDRHVRYRWNRGDVTTQIDFELAEAPGGTRIRQTETGFAAGADAAFQAKRAHQAWGVILGMLELATRT